MTLKRGLYDLIMTDAVARSIVESRPDLAELAPLSSDETSERIVDAIARQLRTILDDLGGAEDERQLGAAIK